MTLVLENTTLIALLANDALVQAFPFLEHARNAHRAAQKGGGCGRCGRGAARVDWNATRATLAGLPDAAKARFKKLAGADRIEFHLRTGNQIARISF